MSHWNDQAKQWKYITEPLKPSAIDISNLTRWIHRFYENNKKPLTILLLGVTPEIVNIHWPKDTRLFTIDKNMAMITSILPRSTQSITPLPIVADWLNLPLKPSTFDVVMGDGCYNLLSFSDYDHLTHAIKSLLKKNGVFIFRFFLRPELKESLETLQLEIANQRIDNFSAFKLRLLMALHDDLKGICLKTVWDCWNQHFKPLLITYKQQLGWSDDTVNVIHNYKDLDIFYTFPTLAETKNHLRKYLNEQEIFKPSYTLGMNCQTLKFSK